jgi:hypothetical protein
LLNEVPLKMHTGAWRSVYSANTRGAEEIMVDEIAEKLGKDPVAFRREFIKVDRQRAVLDKVVELGQWGKKMPKGFAQGVAVHGEYKSYTACLNRRPRPEGAARDQGDDRGGRRPSDQPARHPIADARRADRRHLHDPERRPAHRQGLAAGG